MNKPKGRTATVAKYGDLLYFNIDKDNPLRGVATIGKQTSRTDLAKPYPNWLPAPLKEETMWIMVNLRKTYTNDQIFDFITLREAASILISQQVPDNAKDKIDALIYIQRLIELGGDKGIKAYLGEGSEKVFRNIVESRRQSEAAKNKAGAEGYLKHALRRICQLIGSTSWPKVKEEMKNTEAIEDLYESLIDPININDFQFQGDRLLFKSRAGVEESRKISTIKNILSSINL